MGRRQRSSEEGTFLEQVKQRLVRLESLTAEVHWHCVGKHLHEQSVGVACTSQPREPFNESASEDLVTPDLPPSWAQHEDSCRFLQALSHAADWEPCSSTSRTEKLLHGLSLATSRPRNISRALGTPKPRCPSISAVPAVVLARQCKASLSIQRAWRRAAGGHTDAVIESESSPQPNTVVTAASASNQQPVLGSSRQLSPLLEGGSWDCPSYSQVSVVSRESITSKPFALDENRFIEEEVKEIVDAQMKMLRGSLPRAWPPVAQMSEHDACDSIIGLLQNCCTKSIEDSLGKKLSFQQETLLRSRVDTLGRHGLDAWKNFVNMNAASTTSETNLARWT